ncbi:MAG: hypothetical protein Q3M24_17150 [Candidatus Electrothrix aestuarii]|uniref:Uncharacterized protein n=1 Tax=Candidatus Electrothrix aestuarii TaxID=3062594 RepID=A0AAU8LRT0_9BACT|nr:hypothetical protein [Candidatus Electrothrix aestuarii]
MNEKKEHRTGNGALGFCRTCGQEHYLPAGPAQESALQLMRILESSRRIDFTCPISQADPTCSLDYLWGPARGKMFGVLVAQTADDEIVHLRAFSGQYNGLWQVPGWVDPVFDLKTFHQVQDQEEREIKEMTSEIDQLVADDLDQQELVQRRKEKSQQLMRDIHSLYRLRNFHGQVAGLEKIFATNKGVPTGTGDCCAPKLLQHAILHDLKPLGLAEFYMGKENASGTRQHGNFYSSCQSKCYPILGFMLCGLELPDRSDLLLQNKVIQSGPV